MEPDKRQAWQAIDSRPIPAWYDDAKLGIFIHWGLYSVPAFAPRREEIAGSGMTYSEWYEWQVEETKLKPYYDFHQRCYPGKSYRDFAFDFRAELFRPDEWADLFRRSGAKYLALVTKHHDGYCLWDSTYTPDWNSVKLGPRRDLVADLLAETDRVGLRRGVYYSLTEWFHPFLHNERPDFERYALQKMIPELKELVTKYRPEFLFTDGEWSTTAEQWHSRDFLEWLISESPVADSVVFNDRWGSDTRGLHGGVLTSEYNEVNSTAIGEAEAQENLKHRKWEECRSLSHSFAYNRNELLCHYLTERELITMFAEIVAKGGNLCLNVGPQADGTILPIMQERLEQLGSWLAVNGEAVYGTRPAQISVAGTSSLGATRKGRDRYLFLNEYSFRPLRIAVDRPVGRVELLGCDKPVALTATSDGYELKLPLLSVDEMPCRCVYTLKLVD